MGYRILLIAGLLVTVQCSLEAQDDSAKVRALDEVVVTGQYAPQSLKNSVYRVRTIKQEQIKLRGATDLQGVLNNELGIRFSTDHTLGETDINIMGMSGQNVKVLLDGVPLVDRGDTKQSLSQVDINSVERIEIVEGPMSVVYGADALAGVINIITKKAKKGENFSVIARVMEETTGEFYSPFAKEGVHNENLSLSWQGKQLYAAGYGTRNVFGGWSGNAAFHAKDSKPKGQYMTGGKLGFRNNDLNVWYRLDYLHEDIIANGALNPNNYKSKDQDYITDRYTHQVQAEWQLSSRLKLNGAASYQDYARKTETFIYDYNKNTETPTTEPTEWDVSKFKTAFFRGTAQWVASSIISLQPGIEIKSDKASGNRISGNPTINDYSLFVSAEIKPISGINIRPGVRFSKNSVYDAPPVIPSVNAKFALYKNLDLRVSYARGFRAPALRELYFYFFDASHSIQGNPDLKAEYSNSYNASLSWQSVDNKKILLNSTLSGFYNDFHNRIDLAQTTGSIYTYFNIAKYKTIGTTLDNSLTYKNLSATLGVSYIGRYNIYYDDPSFKGSKQDQFTWSLEVNSNITYRFPKLKASAGFFYKFTGELPVYQLVSNTSTGQQSVLLSKTESYNLADITLSKTLFKYFTIQAGAKNLFDVVRLQNSLSEAGSAHSSSGPILVAYGRSYFAGLLIQWSKN